MREARKDFFSIEILLQGVRKSLGHSGRRQSDIQKLEYRQI
jgi:hypothetical protein